MNRPQYILPAAALLCSGFVSYTVFTAKTTAVAQRQTSPFASTATLTSSATPTTVAEPIAGTDTSLAQSVETDRKAEIFDAVVQRQTELGLCENDTDLAQNLKYSDVYAKGESQYLVSVLCYMAAYQGVYEFVTVDTAQTPYEMNHSQVRLAGFPTYDPARSIVTNGYKFNGPGSCIGNSRYHWDGYSLRLISSTLEDGVANGCEELGVRSPATEQLITATSVGMAQLGMTLGELRQLLPEDTSIEPTQLGVDMPPGMRVSFYGEQQFKLAFDTTDPETFEQRPITDQSKIEWIVVSNPSYMTAEGVGAGTPLAEAIAQYGVATLAYNTESESRESIEFTNGPFPEAEGSRVWIRSNQWTITDFAGIYPETVESSYHQTQNYHDHAAIESIWIMQEP